MWGVICCGELVLSRGALTKPASFQGIMPCQMRRGGFEELLLHWSRSSENMTFRSSPNGVSWRFAFVLFSITCMFSWQHQGFTF